MVYIREAHPTDGWQLASNIEQKVEYAQTHTWEQRQEVANACAIGLKLSMPILIDDADNRADIAFQGWPERLYVLSNDGKIAYHGGKGPFGFDTEELYQFLESYLAVQK